MENKSLKFLLVGSGIFFKMFFYWPEANCPTREGRIEENFQENKIKYFQENTTNFKRNYEFKDSCRKYMF